MTQPHYTAESISFALQSLGISKGDTVFTHSNIGLLGRPEGGLTPSNMYDTIIKGFIDVLGSEGTLILPTFTYSFSKNEIFDPQKTPTTCGLLAEQFRQDTSLGVIRSLDPSVSVAAVGAQAKSLVHSVGTNSYDNNSFFHRFYQAGGIICNINFDAGSTFVHYVERCLQVPYRFDKKFTGEICENGKTYDTESTLYVRNVSSDETITAFEPFHELAQTSGVLESATVGKGAFHRITARDTFDLIEKTLPDHPWLLTRAEKTGATVHLTPEASQ